MTITQAIERADAATPNTYAASDKIRWLSALDGRIRKEIIDRHEGGTSAPSAEYGEETDTVLLVPAPWDELYVHWLCAMIHYANGEIKRYNNALALFDESYAAFARNYTREHMPRSHGSRFRF